MPLWSAWNLRRQRRKAVGRVVAWCPNCASAMVLRRARKGSHAGQYFFGCSRYPRCHGTSPFDEDTFVPHSADRPRSEPYVWATWLSEIMAGDVKCQWKSWFRSHYQLPRGPNSKAEALVEWKVAHNRALSELTRNLASRGLSPINEYSFKTRLPSGGTLSGQVDCLVEDNGRVVVYECKTGLRRAKDQLQLMLYLWALGREPRFRGKELTGLLIYGDDEFEVVPYAEFEKDLTHFGALLSGPDPAPKVPGADCRFCPITRKDCHERIGE